MCVLDWVAADDEKFNNLLIVILCLTKSLSLWYFRPVIIAAVFPWIILLLFKTRIFKALTTRSSAVFLYQKQMKNVWCVRDQVKKVKLQFIFFTRLLDVVCIQVHSSLHIFSFSSTSIYAVFFSSFFLQWKSKSI